MNSPLHLSNFIPGINFQFEIGFFLNLILQPIMKRIIQTFLLVLISLFCSGQKLTKHQIDSIKLTLDKMGESDQKYRWQLMLGELDPTKLDSLKKLPDNLMWDRINNVTSNKIGFGRQIADSIWKLQNEIDSLNRLKFVEIVLKYGYPSFKRTGSSASGYITIHLVGEKEFNNLLTIFKNELLKGNMPATEYAAWHDRCQIFMNKKQFYGEYDQKYPCVADLNNSNIERKKIGLKKLKHNNCR